MAACSKHEPVATEQRFWGGNGGDAYGWMGTSTSEKSRWPGHWVFVVLLSGWKCQGPVGAAAVGSGHWDGGRSLVLPVPGGVWQILPIHLSQGLSSELRSSVALPGFSIAVSVPN